jgi:hypothetical protein
MALAFQLKITLERIEPKIWRRVMVPGNLNLARLHLVIQDAMGWTNDHLHEFESGRMRFGPDPDDFGARVEDEKKYTLERLFEAKDRFRYVYDMGDSWTHEIRVEKVVEVEGTITPRCMAGERACPPEDCGGAWGYAEMVAALADPKHERHEELLDWVGDDWKPEAFDLEEADRLVSRHKPKPGPVRSGSRARPRNSARA